jgi:phosphoglycolate phosphatase
MRWTALPPVPPMPLERSAPPRRFRLIVFDWDGTLADSTALIVTSLREACRDLGVAIPDEAAARYVIGLGLDDALRHVAPEVPPARYPELTARYRTHFLSRDAEVPLFEGVGAMLAELETRGFLLAIATGKSRRGLIRALAQQGIAGHFVATRCADEGLAKPHPDMLLHLLGLTGVRAAEALMIGDTTHDLELARNAGTSALAVAYGAHSRTSLSHLSPLALIDSPSVLREWLRDNA